MEPEDITSKLGSFKYAALKEIIQKDLKRPLRAITKMLRWYSNGTMRCWCDDENFIHQNEQHPMDIYARFVDKEKGDYIIMKGSSRIVAISPGKGAVLHVSLGEVAYYKRDL
jgi:hypothetical protein